MKEKTMNKIALVTGANQGLGLALVRRLCQQWGEQGTVYLGTRIRKSGEEAVARLQTEGLSPRLAIIDVSDEESVESCAHIIQEQHGGIDVLISNAAARIVPHIPSSEQITDFVNTNNHGTVRILRAFAPLLSDGSRLLIVASAFGSLRHLPAHLHQYFPDTTMSLQDVDIVMDAYVQAVREGTAKQEGWPDWINIPSKIGQVVAMRVFARDLQEDARERDILINAVCPGLVDTAASRPWFDNMHEAQSPDEAAEDVIWLAMLPKGTTEPYGELVQHKQVLPFR
jgi:carbonyl reductase 1